jgi:hypothetical protein
MATRTDGSEPNAASDPDPLGSADLDGTTESGADGEGTRDESTDDLVQPGSTATGAGTSGTPSADSASDDDA